MAVAGVAARKKSGETVSGDAGTYFKRHDGKLYLLLCDGMGSGEAARKESALVCRLLQQFLEAGVAPEAALKTLNSAMSLRGADSGVFTTVDLCVYDPGAREAAFYKCGAAPSYIKRGGVVRRVTGASLPVGLQGPPPDVTRAPLAPGGFAVMVSDGVADPAEDEWLLNLLAGWVGPYLPAAVITEMTAVGGALIVALAVNMLELGREKIKVGNMLPAIFLPAVYLPLAQWLGGLMG